MDSLTQIALGVGVSEAVMQNKVGRKASLWGAICGTLPDLDVFIPMSNAVKDFTYHRAESHAFFYLALATPLIVWLILKIHPKTKEHRNRWLLAVFLIFVTHVLLDSFTAYGTQLLLPFSNYPVGWNTIFIVDPLYTLPLLIGGVALFIFRKKPSLGLKWNRAGIIISSLYLIWGVAAQQYVKSMAKRSFQSQNIQVSESNVGPTPFNTFLWRIVATTDEGYVEGFYSVFDKSDEIQFDFYSSENDLLEPISDDWNVQRLQWFTKGLYKVSKVDGKVVMTDLRMGVGDMYFFNFAVGKNGNSGIVAIEPETLEPEQADEEGALKSIFGRIWNENSAAF